MKTPLDEIFLGITIAQKRQHRGSLAEIRQVIGHGENASRELLGVKKLDREDRILG